MLRFLISAFLMALTTPTFADLVVDHGFVRAAIMQQRNSAAFMSIMNQSDKNTSIVKAQSPVANIVELHTHTNDNGIMRMRQIDQIDLPAGKQVVLKPGGLHIMLLGLTQDLKVGEQVEITLSLSDQSKKKILIPIKRMVRQGKM